MQFIDVLNSVSVRLKLTSGNHTIGWATGFVGSRDDVQFLITNQHVLSGINPITKEISNENLLVPDTAHVHFHVRTEDGLTNFIQAYSLKGQNGNVWHSPFEDGRTDVALMALPLPNLPHGTLVITPLGKASTEADIIEEVGMRVVILGFPDGVDTSVCLPVWKTGYIATEPLVDYEQQKMFLVDSYTSPGMSGSPVFLVSSGGHKSLDGNRVIASNPTYKFIGIYSGRVNATSTLGRVWKASEIIAALERSDWKSSI